MKLKNLIFLIPSLFLLTSCNYKDFISNHIVKEIDYSQMYIGGYPYTVDRNDQSKTYDYILYIDFVGKNEKHKENDYDVEVNLNFAGGLRNDFSQSKDSFGNVPNYYDVASGISKYYNFADIKSFFDGGGKIFFFTSVGGFRRSEKNPFVSKPVEYSSSGCVISISTIISSGDTLTTNISNIYKENWKW